MGTQIKRNKTDTVAYVEGYTVVLTHNYCCHGNATMLSIFIVVGVDVAFSDMKVLSFGNEK